MTTYWHMQMHRDNVYGAEAEDIWSILEHKNIIGLGDWKDGQEQIHAFKEDMHVNDIVAIKNGASLIALVQIIGGAYKVEESDKDSGIAWIVYRRPIRILDWATDGETIEQPRGTLNVCKDQNAATTKTIKNWHEKVCNIMKKRKVALTV